MGIASIADVAAKVPRARPSLLLCMAPPQGMDQDRSVASEAGALSASVEARTRTSHGPRLRAAPAKMEVPVRASERSTGAGTLAGSQLQLWTMCTRLPSGEVPVVAVTDGGGARHPLLAMGAGGDRGPAAAGRVLVGGQRVGVGDREALGPVRRRRLRGHLERATGYGADRNRPHQVAEFVVLDARGLGEAARRGV